MQRDLGTYHVIVELKDGRGYILRWDTGPRLRSGRNSCHPLSAAVIRPLWEDEDSLVRSVVFQLTENYCDCNFNHDLDSAYQVERGEGFKHPCGGDIKVSKLMLIRPDLTQTVIYTAP